ncbi:MAG: DNA-binding response regulator [Verrucomicrobiales bacterium]|nr:DNA-binding response regulator [Verrucomicrobiales bacterium]
MPLPIKVCIVEDDAPLRESMSILLNGSGHFKCIATFPNAEVALKQMPMDWPQVVLMDINLPKMSGIECVAKLKGMRPELFVIMLTICGDEDQIFESLKSGASGYLLKSATPGEILEAITEVHSGGAPMSGTIAHKVVRYFQQLKTPAPATNLTKRESEVLNYLAKGYQYKEIADALGIGGSTVRTHIEHIYEKLHVSSRTEAVVKFLKSEGNR